MRIVNSGITKTSALIAALLLTACQGNTSGDDTTSRHHRASGDAAAGGDALTSAGDAPTTSGDGSPQSGDAGQGGDTLSGDSLQGGDLDMNATPVAVTPGTLTVLEDTTSDAFVLTGTDEEDAEAALTVVVSQSPMHGQLSLEGGSAPLSVTYTPFANFYGNDMFAITVTDLNGAASVEAWVAITVDPEDDAFSANDDHGRAATAVGKSIQVLANDVDLDGDTLTITAVGQGTHGTVEVASGGTHVTYTSEANYVGADAFTYTATDGTTVASATVSMSVLAAGWWGLGQSDSLANGGVSNTGGYSSTPDLLVDASGSPTVVWRESDGNIDIYVRRWNPVDKTWDELGTGSASGKGISNNNTTSTEPRIARDSQGAPVVAWRNSTSTGTDIYVRRYVDGIWQGMGTSGTGGGISQTRRDSAVPDIACGPRGYCAVAWRQDQLIGASQLYGRRWNPSTESWDRLRGSAAIDGDTSHSSTYPSIAMDTVGSPIVVWQKNTSGGKELSAARWGGGISTSGSWIDFDTRGITSSGGLVGRPTMALLTGANPVVAWSQASEGDFQILLQYWTGSSWSDFGGSSSGGGVSANTSASSSPRIAITAAGNPIVTWRDGAIGSREVYVRHWEPDTAAWLELGAGSATAGGISNMPGDESTPVIAVGASGDVCVAWSEAGSGYTEIVLKCTVGP